MHNVNHERNTIPYYYNGNNVMLHCNGNRNSVEYILE